MPQDHQSDEDALEAQEQWEIRTRNIAWEQTYGRRPKDPRKTECDDGQLRLFPVEQEACLSSESPDGSTDWARFERISLTAASGFPAVYAILHTVTGQAYVGSTVDVGARIRKHLSDLASGKHHSAKLASAYAKCGASGFEFLLIERVSDATRLRSAEQHWIDQLFACSAGFNSKTRADGPEPSLETHIDIARRTLWEQSYKNMEPAYADLPPTDEERAAFRAELKGSLTKKAKQIVVAGILVYLGLSGLDFLYLALFYYVPVIAFDWPDRPTQRAAIRAAEKYERERLIARRYADDIVIDHVAKLLNVSRERVATMYASVPQILERRARLREKYRQLNYRRSGY